VRKVTRRLERRGYKVFSRESERVGYDLDATKGRTELHVEVKGVSGEGMQFLIAQAEVDATLLVPLLRNIAAAKPASAASH
jgi:hypothetical protein